MSPTLKPLKSFQIKLSTNEALTLRSSRIIQIMELSMTKSTSIIKFTPL